MIRVSEIQSKSVLNKSKIYDYCVNPYTGCQLNCRYCYARLFMRRYSGHKEPWGSFVDVKINAPELLRRQLARAKRGTVWLSSVCDPYQPLEAKYKLTRQCLALLAEAQFPVNIQTKSVLLLRDLDIFVKFREIEVGMTITTEDERIAKIFEPGASPVKERIEALAALRSRGIPTFVFIGPLLPGDPEKLFALLAGKVDQVLVDRMNYLETMIGLYRKLGLTEAATDRFFREQAKKLARQAEKHGLPCDILF
ncbi:MAG: radical SAM protein [Acidobacteriota bacterium]